MRISLVTNWWALVLGGLTGIGLGILTFVWPGITLLALVFLFAGYSLVDGAISLAGAIKTMESHERWGVLVLEGLLGIGAAVISVAWPGITAIALVYVIAAWAIMTGTLEIVASVRLRKQISGEWLLALGGIASVVFGLLLSTQPNAGGLVTAICVGAYAFVFGGLMLILRLKLRSWAGALTTRAFAPAH